MKKLFTCLMALVLALMSANALAYTELPPIQYPVDTDVTLTIWMGISGEAANRIQSYSENDSFIYAQQATGINLKFIHPSEASTSEEFNMMVVSGDLPDIIVNGLYHGSGATQSINGVEDGIYLDLTDYMAEYSPTYWNYLHTNEEFYQDATTPEGRVYYYTNYKTATADEEGSYYRFQVRKDWLDEIGLDTLRTVDDYEKYLQHVLDTKEGVIPMSFIKSGIEKTFLTAFDTFEGWYQIDGKVRWGQVDDGFGDYLKLMNSWYEKGYISPDFTSMANTWDPFIAGETGACCESSAWIYPAAKQAGFAVQNCPYIRQYEGQQIYGWYYLRPANGQYATISSDCEHVAEAMMFMDYGYTQEGSYTYCYGIPEVAWVYGDDGMPKYTDYILDNDKGYSAGEVNYILRLHEGFPHMRDADARSYPDNIRDPQTLAYRMQWQDDPLCDSVSRVLPSLTLPDEDATRRSEIMTEIETYRNEMVLKYITGAEPLDTYPQYQQHIWDLGLQEAIDLTQAAYDAKLAKKLPE